MRKILVIDDDKPTLAMFRLFLSAYGYTVFIAENGVKGLELFEKEGPAIVLTDIKMPGMDGLEVLKRVKEKEPLTEVIVVTGHGDMDLAIQALNLNASDFINKPVQKADLEGALKRAEERLKMVQAGENDYSIRKVNGITFIQIEGNVTSLSEPLFKDVFDLAFHEGADKIVLCLNEQATLNGAGIAVLIQSLLSCQKRQIATAICGLSKNFKKVLEVVGIHKLTAIVDYPEEAVQALKAKN